MDKRSTQKNSQRAQSIIELSLLGAALLGVLGLLISYALSLSQSQTTQLKAMRQALKLSLSEAMATTPPNTGPYSSQNTTPSGVKTGNRRSAAVLIIDDVPTVGGGDKYGSTSYTPTISFGSGTFTNLLQYPVRHHDPSQIPYMDIYVNGDHFTFTTFAYSWGGYYALPENGTPGAPTGYWHWNPALVNCNDPHKCLDGYSDGPNPKIPVWWKQLSRTDEKFCYSINDPADHECSVPDNYPNGTAGWEKQIEERWRLDPVNDPYPAPVVPVAERRKFQWQWYPIMMSHQLYYNDGSRATKLYGINFFGFVNSDNTELPEIYGDVNTSLDVDGDGHEEQILQFASSFFSGAGGQGDCTISARNYWDDGTSAGTDYSYSFPEANGWCRVAVHGYKGGYFRLWETFYVDNENGDLALSYSSIEKKQGKPQPGFTQAKAKIKTVSTGELKVVQTDISSQQQTKAQKAQNISRAKQDAFNIIEREIQLSNDTGRFVPGSPNFANPDVHVACLHDGTCVYPGGTTQGGFDTNHPCDDPANEILTCFDRSDKILYVRSLVDVKTGHKFKTISPITNLP